MAPLNSRVKPPLACEWDGWEVRPRRWSPRDPSPALPSLSWRGDGDGDRRAPALPCSRRWRRGAPSRRPCCARGGGTGGVCTSSSGGRRQYICCSLHVEKTPGFVCSWFAATCDLEPPIHVLCLIQVKSHGTNDYS